MQNKAKQSQSNSIKANKMPKQSQYKPKQTQFQSQYMLLNFTKLEVLENSIITGYDLEPVRPLNNRRLT